MTKPIKTRVDKYCQGDKAIEGKEIILSGFFDGKNTYLGIGVDKYVGILSGNRLYRLAKSIVRQFEK